MPNQDLINDAREYHVFMPAAFDDLGLTLEGFRVYCHLARRANKETRTAYPSYAKIGEACFRGSYPNSSAASLKAKAIAAVDELIAYGLIRKELYDEGDGFKHNIYHLTPQSEWKCPEVIQTINVRKGRPGLERGRNSVNPINPSRLTPLTTPVNTDNPVNGVNSVNPINPSRLTPLTTPVNPTPPKGNTNEGITNEGKPYLLSDASQSDDRGALSSEISESEEQSKQPDTETAGETNNKTESPSSFKSGKGASSPRRSKVPGKNASAQKIYASLKNLDGFNKFWNWYGKKLAACSPNRDGRKPAIGSKTNAAIVWRDQIEPMPDEEYARFRSGCQRFDWNQIGIPHAERFISANIWESGLIDDSEEATDFVPSTEASAPEWLEDNGFIAWLSKSFLPNRPEYRDCAVNVAIARAWLAETVMDGRRMTTATAAWQSYQEHLQRQSSTPAATAAPVATTGYFPPQDLSPEERIIQLEGMAKRGRLAQAIALVSTKPEWGLMYDHAAEKFVRREVAGGVAS